MARRCLGLVWIISLPGCGGTMDAAGQALPTAVDIQRMQATGGFQPVDWRGQSPEELQARGETLWRQCRVCHQVGAGAQHLAGPALTGVVGRKAGSAPGFGYSMAMQSADFVWSQQALDAWLARPWRFLPGTTMQYGGLSNAEDRAALIAYLSKADQ